MSYDISFKVRVEDTNYWVDVGECSANITWNVKDMIMASTGLEWKNECDNGLVKDIIPYIQRGYNELNTRPDKYKKYESPNGWGTVSGCRKFFYDILQAWTQFCETPWYRELINYVHFWIE